MSSSGLTRGSLYGILVSEIHFGNSKIPRLFWGYGIFFILRNSKIPKTKNITNFSGVLGAAAPKGLGRSPYKICELG